MILTILTVYCVFGALLGVGSIVSTIQHYRTTMGWLRLCVAILIAFCGYALCWPVIVGYQLHKGATR